MEAIRSILAASLVIFLGGCVTPPQQFVQLDLKILDAKSGKVGVAMVVLPPVDTYFPGASCLLCLAAASATNSTLTSYAQTLPRDELPRIKNTVADLLRKKGMTVTVIEEDINMESLTDVSNPGKNVARKDFSPLRRKYDIDKLMVIDIKALGFIRTYSAYFPTSEPKGYLSGAGYIVNLSDNTYDWYLPVSISRSPGTTWDEPPKFPALTNAYFQALEMGKDAFIGDLSR
ncbi:MAG: hypothetical protein ACO1PN_11630 [Betaproteobacteria bacterium]